MALIGPVSVGPVRGFRSDDTFLVGAGYFLDMTISDPGGTDTLSISLDGFRIDSALIVENGDLFWRSAEGDSIQMGLHNRTGAPAIEFLEWRFPGDDVPSTDSLRLQIVTDLENISGSKLAIAGTQGDDEIIAPLFQRRQRDWSEAYGNDGDDRMVGSNKHEVRLYGGDGNDTLIGKG